MSLATREMGLVPVSIGTSVAIEYIIEHPNELPKEIWINVRTLFRNLYSGVDVQTRDSTSFDEFAQALHGEMQVIQNTLEMTGVASLKVVFYYSDYNGLVKQFKYANFKQPRTEKQKRQFECEQTCINYILDNPSPEIDFRRFSDAIKAKDAEAWIITHTPVCLLSRRFFSKLTLLETHTGLLKPASKWYTKLTKGRELIRLPFNEMTIQVYGDGGNYFTGFPIKTKKEVYELATSRGWNPLTTRAKIREDLNYLKDPALKAILQEMISTRIK